ncbi:MAG: rRNA maturation RNase YbeY [Phycisphaeraceae bacterium]|nr:rRNA maturation RNase YbeY [Phycisphaeraceae bacterium]
MDDDDSEPRSPIPAAMSPRSGLIHLVLTDRATCLTPQTDRWLHERFAEVAETLCIGGELRAAILNDDEMAHAHRVWTGIDGPTDVLTSDLVDGGAVETRCIDADVLLGADEARRRADELGHPFERELLLYLVHALLHCLGFDDHTPEDAARMHAEEDRVLGLIGVGATYAPRAEVRS